MSRKTRSKTSFEAEKLSIGYYISSKQSSVYDHCLMMIGCGKWPAGMRLPSIRDAEKAWGVNRMAIQHAYRSLASQGVVVSKSRSGYYVTNQEGIHRISDHRIELENLHLRFSDTITKTTGLAPLPVFRYLTKLAQIRDREAPMCAFVECTLTQASAHAHEIAERLGLSVMPMTVADIAGKENRIPRSVSVLLTTYFHYTQLLPLQESGRLEVVTVPVEVSLQLAELTKHCRHVLIVLEKEQQTARTVAEDAGRILNCPPLEIRITSNVDAALTDILESSRSSEVPESFVLVSPHEWNSIDQKWRDHPNVRLVPFRIRDEAWDLIADMVGMPMGALG
ncbi:MAG: winged helix-turn-helix domain-containing protein [candidate division Zixibacteria bacterium]|nr:winged helix-turn-helix domain-containing protein [candidate division Zixibacteria bacterium]